MPPARHPARLRRSASERSPKSFVLDMFRKRTYISSMGMPLSLKPRKGRGAASTDSSRFDDEKRVAFDDGWNTPEDDAPPPLATILTADATRTIIARNDSPDIG